MSNVKFRSSCDACLSTKVKCSRAKPSCARCTQHGRECVYSQCRKIGRPSHKSTAVSVLWPEQRLSPRPPRDAVAGGGISDTLEAQSPEDQAGSCADNLEADTSIGDSVMSLVHDMADSELMANFSTSLEDDLATSDWADVNTILDLPTTLPQTANAVQVDHNQSHLGNIFTKRLSSSPHSTTTQSQGWDPWSPIGMFLGVSSCDTNSQGSPPVPLVPPHQSNSPAPRDGGGGLFRSRPDYPFAEGITSSTTSEPDRLDGTGRSTSSYRPTLASRNSESILYSSPGSRCTLQCHIDLTNQLTYINECQANSDSGLALDVLLKIDDQVRKARDKILYCPVCIARSRCGQTLMLVATVVSNLLALFERGCGAALDAASSSNSNSGSSSRRSSVSGNTGKQRYSPLGTSPSRKRRCSPPKCGGDGSGVLGLFPCTTRHLTVGDVRLDKAVTMAFERQLLRMYLERQIEAVGQLDQILQRAEGRDVSIKITHDLFADVLARVERFLGFIALTDWQESSGIVSRIVASNSP
ncbi:uncharacterized protein F4822DRAFT_163554 [Hypoxylon trugodes]|uniref:uncharacterized protein n=1 Tax=Hypoxylon trugodes TaxID=326681 RepID=UPI00218F6571|nr:uncharacterized protein F4822DRAFT_163554 [Hypoxylon trugodes]KAI1390802.1 hypothetical protein F4822DRAFT_163554 [Hypoxylon trugodes]